MPQLHLKANLQVDSIASDVQHKAHIAAVATQFTWACSESPSVIAPPTDQTVLINACFSPVRLTLCRTFFLFQTRYLN
jgi:hypothetical protein